MLLVEIPRLVPEPTSSPFESYRKDAILSPNINSDTLEINDVVKNDPRLLFNNIVLVCHMIYLLNYFVLFIL